MATGYDPRTDYYAILRIADTATADEIKNAHRARIAEQHPDRGGDTARASVVNVARDVLSDPNTRREYDQTRRDWILKSLESPSICAFLDPDGRLATNLTAQARHSSKPSAPTAHAASVPGPETPRAAAPADRPPTDDEIKAAIARWAAEVAANWPPQATEQVAEKHAAKWRWGLVSEYALPDVFNVLQSGDWLGAIGLLGTALFVDRAYQQHANPEELATADAAAVRLRQERAMAFLENVAGAIGAHFDLDRAEVAARAGAAARKAASSGPPPTSKNGKRRRKRVVVAASGRVGTR